MTAKEKQLLLKDLSARLPYGVKILHTGWDYDSDTDFDTVETLIGIDNRFIYTVWDKTGDREKHCLSVSNWKPYLRPLSSMTDEEEKEFGKIFELELKAIEAPEGHTIVSAASSTFEIDFYNKYHFDYRGLIEKGLAIEVTTENNSYKE